MKLALLVRGENRCPRRKTCWNKVEKHSSTIYMTSSPKSNLRHIGCHRTWNVTPLITMITQLPAKKRTCHGRGQCKKMCSILDIDDVDVSEPMWAHVSSLLTFVLVGALDQTRLVRSKRMHLITQGI